MFWGAKTNDWCSVPDPGNLTALFYASGEGGGGKASHVMGEVIVTSCTVSEIVHPALVGSDLSLALGSFHVNSTTDFGSCSQIYLPLPIFVGHDVLCTFTKYCVLNDVCLQNMAL